MLHTRLELSSLRTYKPFLVKTLSIDRTNHHLPKKENQEISVQERSHTTHFDLDHRTKHSRIITPIPTAMTTVEFHQIIMPEYQIRQVVTLQQETTT